MKTPNQLKEFTDALTDLELLHRENRAGLIAEQAANDRVRALVAKLPPEVMNEVLKMIEVAGGKAVLLPKKEIQ